MPRARSADRPPTTIEPPPADDLGSVPPPKRALLAQPAAAAVLTTMIAIPCAYVLPRLIPGHAGAWSVRSLGLPLSLGLIAVAVFFLFARRRAMPWLAGVAAGGFAGWTVLSLSTALRATPFPLYGLVGDAGRVTAMATRYSVTAASSDMMIKGLPSEYPPLFPWIVGRVSALIDVPAWRLVGHFEILFTGLAVLAGFLLWQRLFSPWLALAMTVLGLMAFPLPIKAYELMSLMVVVPWALLTFANPPRGRLHWLASGLIAGLLIVTYYGWFVFGFFGLAALAISSWRATGRRRELLSYFGKVAVVGLVIASWFVGPLLYAKMTIGGSTVADLYGSSGMFGGVFPFLQINQPGATGLMALAELIGLVGMIWLRGRTWWAMPMLWLVIGAYIYEGIGALVFVVTQHSLLLQYAPSIQLMVMATAAAPTLVYAAPRLFARLNISVPREATALVLAVLVGWAGYTFCVDWMPGAGGRFSDYSERAYREPYPDGHYLAAQRDPTPWFPVTPIQQRVESVLGPNPDAVVLSADERLYAYLPWHGYIGNDLWSSIAHSQERLADIEKLAKIDDPAAFTSASKNLTYGRIDIFVLTKQDSGMWRWTFHQGYNQPEALVDFSRQQFSPADWIVMDDLPSDVVLVIRQEAARG